MAGYLLNIDGYDYRITEKGKGMPFIWLHGMFHSPEVEDVFAAVDFEKLSRHFRIIRIELPAHGFSPVPSSADRLTWSAIACDIRKIVSQITSGKYFAGGFSQGAAITAHLAQKDPHLSGAVLTMLPKIWDQREEVRQTYQKLLKRIAGGDGTDYVRKVFRLTYYPPVALGWNPDLGNQITELMLKLPVAATRMILEGAILSDMPSPEILSSITAPVILAGWDNDMNHPLESCVSVGKIIPPVASVIMTGKNDVNELTNRIIAFFGAKS